MRLVQKRRNGIHYRDDEDLPKVVGKKKHGLTKESCTPKSTAVREFVADAIYIYNLPLVHIFFFLIVPGQFQFVASVIKEETKKSG